MNVLITGPHFDTAHVCMPILRSLPDWFGIEEALIHYSTEIDLLPTWTAQKTDRIVGFISIKQHTLYSAEVYVMGVLQDTHRHGIGRGLIEKSQEWVKQQGIEYLQVKTLGPSHSDESYANTRAFYLAMGFRPLEEFKQIWDEHNPCLIMVKRL